VKPSCSERYEPTFLGHSVLIVARAFVTCDTLANFTFESGLTGWTIRGNHERSSRFRRACKAPILAGRSFGSLH